MSQGCEYCIDPDGYSCYPIYGLGPHRHANGLLGETEHLPRDQWPDNYREDPDEEGFGVWWCGVCGDGKPEHPRDRVVHMTGGAFGKTEK